MSWSSSRRKRSAKEALDTTDYSTGKKKLIYEIYRSTTVGIALFDTLDLLRAYGLVSEHLAMKVFEEFDKSISAALPKRGGSATIEGKLSSYQCYNDVYNF